MKLPIAVIALVLPAVAMPLAAQAQNPAAAPVALAPAAQEPAADLIGDLLATQETTDVVPGQGEVKSAEPPPTPAETSLPAAPIPYTAQPPATPATVRTVLDRPVMVHETGVSPDGPPDISQLTYETRVRGSIAAAQGLQGPLDGAWLLSGPDGGRLYAFQMVDTGRTATLEGAYRDLRRGEAIGGVGLIDAVERSADGALTLRFHHRAPDETVVVQLAPTAGGGWSGTLHEAGAAVAVTLLRDGPAAPAYTVLGVSSGAAFAPRPYDSRVYAPASAKKATAKKPAKKKAPAKKRVRKKRS